MAIFKFNDEMFPSLLDQDFKSGYHKIGLNDLSKKESAVLEEFFRLMGEPIEPLNTEDVLLVKVRSNGSIDKIYGAALWKHPDHGLVLKCGANLWACYIQDKQVVIGELEGGISFADTPIEITVQDESGQDVKVDWYGASIEFLGTEHEYHVSCKWNPLAKFTPTEVKSAIKQGKPIEQWFNLAPSGNGGGGSEAVAMQELGAGDYPLAGYRSVATKYGEKYILKLKDGREVWSRGKAQTQIGAGSDLIWDAQEEIEENKYVFNSPLVLKIFEVKQRKDGKIEVDCAIRAVKLPESTPELAKKPEPVAVGAVLTPATGEAQAVQQGLDYDQIPF